MPLTQATLNTSITWNLTRTNAGGFNPTKQGTDSLLYNLNALDVTTWNQLYAKQFTLASSASVTIDLTAVTNLVYESVTFTGVLTFLVQPTGSECTVAPGVTNGLPIFGGTNSVVVPAGGILLLSYGMAGSGTVVDSTHKTLDLTNSGLASGTYDVVVLGSA